LRKDSTGKEKIAVVCNFTPVVRQNYRIGVNEKGVWTEVFNSDAPEYGGSGVHNTSVETELIMYHGKRFSITLTLPPLAAVYLRWDEG
ncbi:MAG: alpha amylase C-terminal domain-containing protein, partial [Cytophagales bacterium]|nr:alpha amylase C-terminal domain-containing protein [Cytophagales bacterium]